MTQPNEWDKKKSEIREELVRQCPTTFVAVGAAIDWARAETLKEVEELVAAAMGIRDDSYEIINDGHPPDCDLCKRHTRFVEALAKLKGKEGG